VIIGAIWIGQTTMRPIQWKFYLAITMNAKPWNIVQRAVFI
jgi:hypothetical protein